MMRPLSREEVDKLIRESPQEHGRYPICYVSGDYPVVYDSNEEHLVTPGKLYFCPHYKTSFSKLLPAKDEEHNANSLEGLFIL